MGSIRPEDATLQKSRQVWVLPPPAAKNAKSGRKRGKPQEVCQEFWIREALDERLLIDKPLPPDIRKDTPQEYEYKADRLKRSSDLLAQARLLFDLRSAAAFVPETWGVWATLLSTDNVPEYASKQKWWAGFEEVRQRERFFHWQLEFPEVFFWRAPRFPRHRGESTVGQGAA
jgi:hypothetical protein